MPTASSASRPSVSAGERRAGGEAVVAASTAPCRRPAARRPRSSRSRDRVRRATCALPTRSPPTSFETQVRVIRALDQRQGEQLVEGRARARCRPSRGSAAASRRASSCGTDRARCRCGRSPGRGHEGRHTVDGHGSGGGVQHVRIRGRGQPHVGRALAVTGERRHCAAAAPASAATPAVPATVGSTCRRPGASVARLLVHGARSSPCAGPSGPAVPEQRGEPGGHAGQGRDDRERSRAGPGRRPQRRPRPRAPARAVPPPGAGAGP